MKKNLIIFLAILTAICGAFFWYDNASYMPCAVTEKTDPDENFSDLQITFNSHLPTIDSFYIGALSWETSCVEGTLEENASWIDSSYTVLSKETKTQKNGVRISITIKHDAFMNLDECETPGKLYIPVTLYTKGEAKSFTLRTSGPEIKKL